MNRSLPSWFRHLSIRQKFFLSFGLILSLLALSLTALLFYLARINSYVDRQKRITVPAIVTAANMRREAYDVKLTLSSSETHSFVEAETLKTRLQRHASELSRTLAFYKGTHAARTHPVLYGMLADHQRLDLAEQEDRAIDEIAGSLRALTAGLEHLDRAEADRLMTRVMQGLDQLMEAHTQMDIEMKHEGDRLVDRARLTALSLALLLGLVIAATYALASRHIARPLTALAAAADRVAHHDLSAQFPSWPSGDEVGLLAGSLGTMLGSLREHSTSLLRKTKEMEAFTYSIAHDLKGPLREIEGFSSLLEKQFADGGDPRTLSHIGVIRQSALRLTHMIDALLRYSRLEQQALPRQRFNVREMIMSLLHDRSSAAQTAPPAIHVDVPFDDLYGEPISIRQALANLLDNAVKFSRHQAVAEIRIDGWRSDGEDIIRVSDNGIGFDMAQAEKIFGLFERLHGHHEYEGTGVGLAIVRLVMDKHGGRVTVESAPGRGSTFTLVFPRGTS
ncbi:MAG TPA: HAMP domain-containing sensor histidine kinase [Nitrospira sp.]|nr:HAMP domain-containing sensor histidine kinase [Nitrospira sp.]